MLVPKCWAALIRAQAEGLHNKEARRRALFFFYKMTNSSPVIHADKPPKAKQR